MSFQLPHSIPRADNDTRHYEDAFFERRFRSRGREGPDNKDQARLFYDEMNPPKRKRGMSKGFWLLVALIFGGLLYWWNNRYGPAKGLSFWSQNEDGLTWAEKQERVKQAFRRSWAGYEKHAWGKDEYYPLSKGSRNMIPKGMGWIIIDSLDTMMLMGLQDELIRAREWIKHDLDWDQDHDVSVFETSIRMLGGLLSAHYLSGDDLYLDKAQDLGNRLLGAFESSSGLPYASVNLHTERGIPSHDVGGLSSTSEVTSIQLEFKYLAYLTGNQQYWEKAEKAMQVVERNNAPQGLVPIYISPVTGKYGGSLIRLGSRGDSYYEYLIKQYLQTNNTEPVYKDMYDQAVQGIKSRLVQQSRPDGLVWIGELQSGLNGPITPKVDHLVCFVGGMLGLGVTEGKSVQNITRMQKITAEGREDLALAHEITRSCVEMYSRTATGLAPEIIHYNTDPSSEEDFYIKRADRHNLMRPETVESLFVLWRITSNEIYRHWGWQIFQAFEQYAKVDGGYTCLNDVTQTHPVNRRDNTESFWFSETLKYLYLLFGDDDVLPLDEFVLNTEAHPLPKFNPGKFNTHWTRSNM